jgi:energy-coupling factor transporter transmembrane protein EcfT
VAIEYRPGHSPLHRLDARTKLAVFLACTVLVLLFEDPLILGALFLGLYAAGARSVDRRTLNRNLRPLLAIFTTFFVFNLIFYRPPEATFLFQLVPGTNWVPVTLEGLVRSVAVFFRFFVVVLALHLMLYTTAPSELVLGLTHRGTVSRPGSALAAIAALAAVLYGVVWRAGGARLLALNLGPLLNAAVAAGVALLLAAALYHLLSRGLPAEIGLALSIGFATVGLLTQQTQKILDAQQARGYETQYRNPFKRLRALAISLLPIFWATLERSQHISLAILARAFDYNIRGRTYRRALEFTRDDYFVLTVLVVALLLGLTASYYQAGNPSERLLRALLNPPT